MDNSKWENVLFGKFLDKIFTVKTKMTEKYDYRFDNFPSPG